MDTPIYSRTNGYLRSWFFDIGARVRKGQLMALIETPEVDQQLQVAQADLKSAQANLDLANTTSSRYQNLLKTNSVSKQETDVAVSDAAAKKAAVDASMANVRRLEQLQSFEKVYAPFDGIVTARNTDVGRLISAGQNTTPQELFHLAAIGKIRVYAAVPQAYVAAIKDGGKATLTLDEYPGRSFEGTIARNSNAIDQASRTLSRGRCGQPEGRAASRRLCFCSLQGAGSRGQPDGSFEHAALPLRRLAGRRRSQWSCTTGSGEDWQRRRRDSRDSLRFISG
jgi:RND family efflux transporter MFP subunit